MVSFKKLFCVLLMVSGIAVNFNANAASDLQVSNFSVPRLTLDVGESVIVAVDVTNDSASTTSALNPTAALSGMTGFSISTPQSMTVPNFCQQNGSLGTAYCSINTLAPGATFSMSMTITAVTPGTYELIATSSPKGTNTTNDSFSKLVIINAPPQVIINPNLDESYIPSGSSALLSGYASDADEGDISAQINWFSNIDGPIAIAASVNPTLSDGRHSIRATITDNTGSTNFQEVQIVVGNILPDMPTIRTFAGTDTAGFSGDGGPARLAKFSAIAGATRTPNGNIYLVDNGNKAIRKIDVNGIVTTLYSGTSYANITAITSDNLGNVYWASNDSDSIKKLTPAGTVSTFAGGGSLQPKQGFSATSVYLDSVSSLAVNNAGELFIAISNRNQVYKIGLDNLVHVVAGNGVNNFYPTYGQPAISSPISYPQRIALDSQGRLYIAQNTSAPIGSRIFKVDEYGILSLYAGSNGSGYTGDFGPAVNAKLGYLNHLLMNSADELLLIDSSARRIRKIDTDGIITTVFGNGSTQVTGDGGFAADAGLGNLVAIAQGGNDDLLIIELNRIRKIFFAPYSVDASLTTSGVGLINSGASANASFIVDNLSSDPVENIFLTLDAANILPNSITGADYCTEIESTIKCRLNSLGANSSKTLAAQLNTSGSGVREVAATVSSYFSDINPDNNQKNFSYTVNSKPSINILSPQAGTSIPQTESVQLQATASDIEDGNLNTQITWNSNLSGNVGQGENINAQLSPGTHILTARVVDSNGGMAEAQVNLVVTEVNTAPTISILSPANLTERSIDAGPVPIMVSAQDTQDGNLSGQAAFVSSLDGAISSPASLSVGTHFITASVTDSGGLNATSSIQITITPHVNTAPQITFISPVTQSVIGIDAGPIIFSLNATDVEDGNVNSSVILSSSLDGAFTSPAILSEGNHVITATVSDSEGLTATQSINITVAPHVNQAPVISIQSPLNGATFTSSQAITLSAQANDAEDGNLTAAITWKSSISGTITSPTILSAGTHTLTASVSDGQGKVSSASVQVTVTIPQAYCSSRGNTSTYEWINRVTFGNQAFQSGNNLGYYNGISTVINMAKSTSLTVSLVPGFRSTSYTEYWSIWIDLNRNGLFDTNERLFTGNGKSTINGSFTIPVSTTSGLTRMRVSMKYAAASQPCESFSYGEVEDYSVNIL